MPEENTTTAATLDGSAFARVLGRLMETRDIPADEEHALELAERSGLDRETFRARLRGADVWVDGLPRLAKGLVLSAHEMRVLALAFAYEEEHELADGSFALSPTVIVRVEGDSFGVVTARAGEAKALLVFRSPEEAQKYQEQTGKHQPSEGFQRVHADKEGIAAILDTQGIPCVAMPEPWRGGDGGVDTFTAANFLQFLDEADHGAE